MVQEIEQIVVNASILGPLVFVAIYALATVLLVPASIVTLAAGAIFGPFWGTVLTVIGAAIGATAAFLIAKRGGRRFAQRASGRRAEKIDQWLEGRGFLAVLYARLIPIVPFNLFNYAAGFSSISTRDYVAGTVLGIIPGTYAFVALGDAFKDPGSTQFVFALSLVLALALAAPVIEKLRARRQRASAAPTN